MIASTASLIGAVLLLSLTHNPRGSASLPRVLTGTAEISEATFWVLIVERRATHLLLG